MKYLDYLSLFDGDPAELACFSTFNFDADFFERRMLRTPTLAKARRIMIFMDSGQWRKLLSENPPARALNRRYLVVPIRRGQGVFHPKLNLLISSGCASLQCGSANLTRAGCSHNLELVNAIKLSLPEDAAPDPVSIALMSAAFEFFESAVVDAEHEAGRIAVSWLKEARTAAPWLVKPAALIPKSLTLLHTYSGKLWDQAMQCLGDFTPTRVMFVSPFYDDNAEIVHRVRRQWPTCRIEIVAQQDTTTLPVEKVKSLRKALQLSVLSNNSRRLHAKLAVFENPSTAFCLVGSANMTTAAMDGRNVEVCLFFRDVDEHIGSLFDAQLVKSSIELEEFNAGTDIEPQEPLGNSDLTILREAILIEGDRLRVSYRHQQSDRSATLSIAVRCLGETRPRASLPMAVRAEATDTLTLPKGVLAEANGALLASLVAETSDSRTESAPIFVIQEQRLTHEFSGDHNDRTSKIIEETGHGLAEYLEELGSTQGVAAVIEYLNHLNIRFFDSGNGATSMKPFRIKQNDPFLTDAAPDWLLRPDLPTDNLRQAILDFVDRHERQRLRRHAQRGNINGMENFLDILMTMVRVLYVYHRRNVVEKGYLIGSLCRYVALATNGIDESDDWSAGYLASVRTNLRGERKVVKDVCRQLNFMGSVWAVLVVAQTVRFDPLEIPKFGRKANTPNDCLPTENSLVGKVSTEADLFPKRPELREALRKLNCLSEDEADRWVQQAELQP